MKSPDQRTEGTRRGPLAVLCVFTLVALVSFQLLGSINNITSEHDHGHQSLRPVPPRKSSEFRRKCRQLHKPAGPDPEFLSKRRLVSDRYVNGTKPVLIRNAKILTAVRNGTEIVFGDILLENGLVAAVGYIPKRVIDSLEEHELVDLNWKHWVSPGLFDLHSHIGTSSAPYMEGEASQSL